MIVTTRCHVSTHGQGDVHDLTGSASDAVRESGLRDGLLTVFVVGSTASVTTLEFEPGAVADLSTIFERLIPRGAEYRHHLTWGDDNGSSHARASLVGPSITIPVQGGQVLLGQWQQIVLLEFDTRRREREVVLQVVGEAL